MLFRGRHLDTTTTNLPASFIDGRVGEILPLALVLAQGLEQRGWDEKQFIEISDCFAMKRK